MATPDRTPPPVVHQLVPAPMHAATAALNAALGEHAAVRRRLVRVRALAAERPDQPDAPARIIQRIDAQRVELEAAALVLHEHAAVRECFEPSTIANYFARELYASITGAQLADPMVWPVNPRKRAVALNVDPVELRGEAAGDGE